MQSSVRTSQEAHYISATKPNRLMLFKENISVYCENHTGHINYKNSVRTSQETHYVTATKTNRLMLFREIIAVYCENHTEHTNTPCGQNIRFFKSLKQVVHIATIVLIRDRDR
jgi:hypothetical protein